MYRIHTLQSLQALMKHVDKYTITEKVLPSLRKAPCREAALLVPTL